MLGRLFGRGTHPKAELERRMQAALEHHRAQRWSEAEEGYRAVLAIDPRHVDALNFLGVVAYHRGSHDRAVASYRRVLEIAPQHVDAYLNLADAYLAQGEPRQAIASFRSALQIKPDIALAHHRLGDVLLSIGQADEAADSYRKVVQLRPEFVDAHYGLGIACRDLGRKTEAIACFRKVLELRPDLAQAHHALGYALSDEDQGQAAQSEFRAALALQPDYAEARWSMAMSQLPTVYRAGDEPKSARAAFAAELNALEAWFDGNEARTRQAADAVGSAQPFNLAYQEENNCELLRQYGALCVRLMTAWQRGQAFAARTAPPPDDVVRVGIVSAHFREHSVWNAIVKGWFQELDRARFSLHAFDLGLTEDAETRYARSRAASFARGPKSLRQWVDAIRAQQLHVLVYPEIGMDPTTLRLACLRLAPVQAATWGHPETTGLPTIDYFLSAEALEPPEAQANYAERLVTLPHLGCYLEPRRVEALRPDLGAAGIGPDTPVLLCPGVPYKYAPQHDRVFVDIARKLGNCRFVFFAHWNRAVSERFRARLEAEFTREGLRPGDFITFIPWQSPQAFHGWLQRAQVYLDTIGFSGFNTALQAIECDLPIVTREGRFLRGRLASGLLRRAGVPELVAASEGEYVAQVTRLATDAAYRKDIGARLAAGRAQLFHDREAIRALEEFLQAAAARLPRAPAER